MRVVINHMMSHDSDVQSSSSHEPSKVASSSLLELPHHVLQTTDSACEQIQKKHTSLGGKFWIFSTYLNLVLWPQANVMVKFKFGEGVSQCISSSWTLQACVYVSGSVACRLWSHLKDLNKVMSLQIYKKYNWQLACTELAICAAYILGHQARPRVQLQALRHSAKIILPDFNLPVSILTAKLPNLIPHQIFRLYGMSCLHAQCVCV